MLHFWTCRDFDQRPSNRTLQLFCWSNHESCLMPSVFFLYLDDNAFPPTVSWTCFRRLPLIYMPEWQKVREVRKTDSHGSATGKGLMHRSHVLIYSRHIPAWRVLDHILICCLCTFICKHFSVKCNFFHKCWKNRSEALIAAVFRCCAIVLTCEHLIHSKSSIVCVLWV